MARQSTAHWLGKLYSQSQISFPTRFRQLVLIVLLLCVLVFACFAHTAFRNLDRAGFLWLAAAGAFLTLSARLRLPGLVQPSFHLNLATRRRRQFGLGMLIVSAFLLFSAATIFTRQLLQTSATNGEPWNLFVPGLLVWAAGGWLLTRNEYPIRVPRPPLLLLAVIGAALFLRVYLLDTLPLGIWYDEADWGLEARRILTNPEYRPVFNINASFAHLSLYATMLGIFGPTTVTGMRLVAMLFAVGTVVMGYIVGRQIHGNMFGLLMAVVLATMRWSINFSRIAMNGTEVGFFTLLALYFLVRLVRHGQMRDAVLAGLTIGIGLWFYRAFQAMLPAFALFLLLHWKFRSPRKTVALGLTLCVNVLVVVFPLVIFALTQAEYFNRVRTVSVFTRPQNSPVIQVLAENTVRHLEMFHLRGDPNGRHNLPGEPMLDPVTGIVFGFGLIVALSQRGTVYPLFFAAVLLLGLSGGIITLPFEAPQSLRSIGVLPAIAYFAAVGAFAFGRAAYKAIKAFPVLEAHIRYVTPSLGVIVLALILTAVNYDTYFHKQRFDYRVWREYSTYETLVGRILAQQDADTIIYTSPFVFRHRSQQFVAEEQANRARLMTMPDALPVRLPPTQKVILFFVPRERMLYEYAQRLYPNARFQAVTSRDYGVEPPEQEPELFYTVELQPSDIAAVQGLDSEGRGIFYAPAYREYTFAVESGATLTLNGQTFSEGEFTVRLAQGNHQVQLTPPEARWWWVLESGREPVPPWLLYHAPVAFEGVRAAFYANGHWSGSPVTVETHPFIYQYIQVLPMDRPYSVVYSGQIYAPHSGDYTFHLTAIDYARLMIDRSLVVETPEPNRRASSTIHMASGWHDIEVRRQDLTGGTYVYLEWIPPGCIQALPVPMQRLRPENTGETSAPPHSDCRE